MVNTLITPTVLLPQAVGGLAESSIMLPLIYRDFTTQFTTAKAGDTLNIRQPTTFVSNTFDRAVGIVVQDINESTIPVVLDTIEDVSFGIDIEDLTLQVGEFDNRFIVPAMNALAKKVDTAILNKRSAITQIVGNGTSAHTWDKPEVLIDAGLKLNINEIEDQNRYAVIGPNIHAKWLDSDLIKNAHQSGSTAALRQASVGANIFGFDVAWTAAVKDNPAAAIGAPLTEVGIAFHRDAFAFASAPLETPPGSNAAVRQYKGLSIRIAWAYDHNKKRTIVSCDTLFGVNLLYPNRAVKIQGPNRTS